MEDTEDTIINASENKIAAHLNNLWIKLVETLFSVFYTLFKDYNNSNRFETKTPKLYLSIIQSIIFSVQVMGLSFPPKLDSWGPFT